MALSHPQLLPDPLPTIPRRRHDVGLSGTEQVKEEVPKKGKITDK